MLSSRQVVNSLCKILIVFIIVFSFPSFSRGAGSNPLAVVKSGTDRAIDILKSQSAKNGASLRDRKDEILTIVDEYFSFQAMARRALGRAWKDQSPDKQKEFVALFKQMLFNTYIGRVESFTYSDQKVAYDEEKIEGKYALVKTRVIGFKDADVEVNYRLELENGQWKVYDVVVEGISFINNYRQQFDSILANESFDKVLMQMREKVASPS